MADTACAVKLVSQGRTWQAPRDLCERSVVLTECREAGGGEVPLQHHSDEAIQAWVEQAAPRKLDFRLLLDVLQVRIMCSYRS